ncbi:hypothetical protein BDN70DRAFT_523643 [Pholiota conissans]|uniref:Uncharacterized protein n=1 Tax=Pholiota conissans TaxID=109636 RepID=A0A9P5Z7E9_9AGAR|nr:hypothetical protein BDN70DRAFT_523643 [Pholiota conissans]
MTDLHRSTSTAHHQRRHRQPLSHSYSNMPIEAPRVTLPWEHMTKAYAWVADQEEHARKHHGKTEEWVREQQYHLHPKTHDNASRPRGNKIRRQEWEELIYVYGIEADQWMKQEARARRIAEEREKARIRIQEELRRIEMRYQEKREAEAREREERRQVITERRAKEARDRAKLDKLILDAWTNYETRWAALASSSEPLEFKKTPWPLIIPPRNTGDITRDAIVAFLFSPLHSQNMTRKDRIRSAQLRWHPDRFRRFAGRIPETEKAAVDEGVGIVARCLNELMEREKRKL